MTAPATPLLPNLPLHLMLTMGCWLSSPFALQCVKNVLPPLSSKNPNHPNAPKAAQLKETHLKEALSQEARSRASSLLSGLLRYAETPYVRNVTEPPCIWRSGNARLLDYGALTATKQAETRPVVLFVPSLINRYYILDLEEERSMLRFLATQGLYPLVLDWGQPGEEEAGYGCEDYVLQTLLPAIDFITRSGQPLALAGYCMGGVLSVAAARLRPKRIAGLALLATPWDFHCQEFSPFILEEPWRPVLQSLLAEQRQLPADVVQSLFYITDPWVFEQKFRRFSELQPESRAAKDFIALEHWVNDGVPMTAGVAHDCLMGWAQGNILAKKQWTLGGKRIDPAKITLPAFIAIPRNDHVVPHGCAMALAAAMPHAIVTHPGAGHVGMIVGSHARRELWSPFAEWVHQL